MEKMEIVKETETDFYPISITLYRKKSIRSPDEERIEIEKQLNCKLVKTTYAHPITPHITYYHTNEYKVYKIIYI